MKEAKRVLIVLSLIITAIIIYCTALVVKLTIGTFLFENGLFDLQYSLLFFAVAFPIILYILIANGRFKKNIFEVISFSVFFISMLYVPVYFILVSEDSPIDSQTFILSFLVTSVFLVATSHFGVNYHSIKGNKK